MNKGKNILLIVEGKRTEPRLLRDVFSRYGLLPSRTIVPYNAIIYDLYRRIFRRYQDDWEDIDFLAAMRELFPGDERLMAKYTDIILVFDYDPQDERFDAQALEKLLVYFRESTENGKLYISYPCIEAYKAVKENESSLEFMQRSVSMEKIREAGGYKSIAGEITKHKKTNGIKKAEYDELIIFAIKKARWLEEEISVCDPKIEYPRIDPLRLLKKQNNALAKNGIIYELSTALFFICDYDINLIDFDT